MHSSPRKSSRLLGYSYLFLAVLGIFYFVMSYYIPAPTTDKAILADLKNAQLMMLAFVLMELILAAYVRTAINLIVLFAQSLATMLILCGHIFVSVGYFSGVHTATFNAGLAVYISVILLAVAVLLHLLFVCEDWLDRLKEKRAKKHVVIEEDPFAEVDALYGEY
jgi:magnesium-transporting ATPase (P-type)